MAAHRKTRIADARIGGLTGLAATTPTAALCSEPLAVWVHAASAGDVAAIAPLVRQLDATAAFTTNTRTGQAMARKLFPAALLRSWPWLHAQRFADRVRPKLLLLEGLELWPPMIAVARGVGARVVIVNGRISPRSLRAYHLAAPVFRRAVQSIDYVCARSSQDADRFVALGIPAAQVAVTGWTKYDAIPPERQQHRDSLLLASTHRGEEGWLATATANIGWPVTCAPRYPRRAPAVRRMFGSRALVLDTMGDLATLYGRALVAFVGGSLVPRGGHNVLEAAAAGAPVLTGPHIETVADEMLALERADAGFRVTSRTEFVRCAVDLANDSAAGARAREVARSFRGATARCLEHLRALLRA